MAKVKICANKSVNDAKMSMDAGADIIGILVGQEHNSTDFVDKETAKEICEYVNGKCDVSLVTHLTDADEIINLTKYIGNNVIQLHSDIEESEIEKIVNELPEVKLVRLIHISESGEICSDYESMKYADYYLLDSFNLKTNQVGGTGLTHDWKKSGELIKILDKPTFLAGGLNPDNVMDAIKVAKPYGVDVNSGCKNNAGVKDAEKVKLFVKNAKIKKLIFDLDNTLLFLSSDWEDGYQDFILKYDLNITPKELFSCIGTFEANVTGVATYEMMCDYVNGLLSINMNEEMLIDLMRIYKDVSLLNTEEVYDTLSYLSDKYYIIAYTNWFKDNQIERLKKYDLDKFFKEIYGWDQLPIKPSYEGIEEIVGNNDISEYIFIGDNLEADIEVPDNMGMETIFYNRKNIEQDKYKQILNIKDLRNIL